MARPRIDTPDPEHDALFTDTLMRGMEIIALRSLSDREDARDAVQEALTRAMRASRDRRIPEGVAMEAYVHGILRHVIADRLRARMKERSMGGALEGPAPPSADPLQLLVTKERASAVRDAVSRLSGAERRLLEAIFVRGERTADIARRSGVPASRLRKRKSRALKRLRKLLGFLAQSHS